MSQQGTTGLIQQASTYTSDPRGITTTLSWIGTHSDAYNQMLTYRSAGWQANVMPMSGTPRSVVTATVRNEDDTVETIWELDVQWQKVDVEQSQSFNAYMDTLASDTDRAAKIAELQDAADEVLKSYATTKFDALGSDDKKWCLSIIRNDAVDEPLAVLRRVNQYPSFTTKFADWTDVNKVFTSAQITSADPPSAIVGTLPTAYYWLKTSGGVQYAQDGSFTVTTHWVSGRYPSHLYTYKT